MFQKRDKNSSIFSLKSRPVRISINLLGGILCGLLGLSLAIGKVQNFSSPESPAVGGRIGHGQDRGDLKKRRDPFRPIKKRSVISSSNRKAQSDLPPNLPVQPVANPNWKLLGIIEGQLGRQAVLQISPHERVFVRPGLEVAHSGWIIKTIGREEVLFEYSSTSILENHLSSAKSFILSFATLGQSS